MHLTRLISALCAALVCTGAAAGNSSYVIKIPIPGIKPTAEKSAPLDTNVFRFRHEKHDTEGWADIVLVKVKSDWNINGEAAYRAALQEAGFDTYYTQVTSWRCDPQAFGKDKVPEVDYGCATSSGYPRHAPSGQYVLIHAPEGMDKLPRFSKRSFNTSYGVYGDGRWAYRYCGNSQVTPVIGSTHIDNLGGCTKTSAMAFPLLEGEWIYGVDPKTDRRKNP